MGHRRTESRRGLLVVALLLLLFLAVVDLLRSDSVIRGAFAAMGGSSRTPLERFIDDVRP